MNTMFKNYLKIALRNLGKQKAHAFINIFGLAVGVACCLLIMLYVQHEWSYDRFHSDADRLYRAWGREVYDEDEVFFYTITPIVLAPTLETTFPEVEATVRVNPFSDLVQRGDDSFTERIHMVDPNFFEVFDFPLQQGDPQTVLTNTNSIVLTPEIAGKYFGDDDPMGQTLAIHVNDAYQSFVVRGIAEAPPTHSSIQFEMLVPHALTQQLYGPNAHQSWTNIFGETYVLLREGTTGPALEAKMPTMLQQALGEHYGTYEHTIGLQPITDIHLNPEMPTGIEPTSDPAYSYILGAIALFVLLIACINFMTLSIGRSADRAREVGVRKAIGAARRQVMVQFWGEALLMTALSLALGVVLAEVLLPLFNDLSGQELALTLNGPVVLVLLGLLVLIGFAAGSYPAAVLSNFRPTEVLKGQIQTQGDKSLLRRGLVVVQFALSIFLIASTLIMTRQLDYLQTRNLGFDKEQVVVVPTGVPVEEGEQIAERFRSEVAGQDAVAGLTVSAYPLDEGWINVGYTDDSDIYREFYVNMIDPDFVEVMGMEIVAGRDFDRAITSDAQAGVLVNEALVASYGWDDAIGKRLPGRNFPDHEIVGVVRDFNYQSLRSEVLPAAMVLSFDVFREGIENVNSSSSSRRDLSIRIKPGDIPGTLALLEKTWATVAPGQTFDFRFLDASVNSQYEQETRLGQIVGIASLLAILIACLGLFGLATLAVARRTKEIGIRKVLGASVPNLVRLLSKDFAVLVLVAFVVAVPAAYVAMQAWLQDFAFRIEISWLIFLMAGSLALAIALATVSYHAIKAALADPVDSLRYE